MAKDLLLHLDTATEACSVCLSLDEEPVSYREAEEPLSHTSMLTVLIQNALEGAGKEMAGLSAVSVGLGPGSYTGLRVGLSTAKGICFALGIPLIAVSSLEGLAYGAAAIYGKEYDVILPMIDARRMEVYTAIYHRQLDRLRPPSALVLEETLVENWMQEYGRCLAAGNGAVKSSELTASRDGRWSYIPLPSRADYLALPAWKRYNAGYFSDIAYTEPVYLKPPHITKSRKTLF